ncbi:MAG: FtsX-like permease family protein [Gemmatimonadota bacterium]|nr:FtsX-like permease family protein [Gemmatimonadota bacterium]
MTIWHLVTREIAHQKLTVALVVLSVVVAVGLLVAQLTLLEAHDEKTRRILAEKQAALAGEMAVMQDDYRKIMKKIGFNLLILPGDQSLDDYYATGYSAKYMPEEYVGRLAASGIMTIRHLLPSIEQKIQWPEHGGRTVILAGTRGEVPFTHRAPREPMLLAVAPGQMVIGHGLAISLALEAGDSVELMGKKFRVSKVHPERGNRDDITVWIDLAQAQELLGQADKINAILALKCHCAGNDLSNIRQQLGRILPGTRVIEVSSRVVTRVEARDRAKHTAQNALVAERENRARLRAERESLAAWLIPLVLIGCAVWIGLLALGNVRQRRGEIGILRAIGLRAGQIFLVFLTKAFMLGVAGAVLGYAAGFMVGLVSGELSPGLESAGRLFDPLLLTMVLVFAPLLTVMASYIPALLAARQDPAEVLREE